MGEGRLQRKCIVSARLTIDLTKCSSAKVVCLPSDVNECQTICSRVLPAFTNTQFERPNAMEYVAHRVPEDVW